MAEMLRLLGMCILAVSIAQLLKGTNPVGAFLTVMTAVVLLAVRGILGMQEVFLQFEQMAAWAGWNSEIYAPVIKVIGISAIVRVGSAMCRDAGASALAFQLEVAGASAALIVCIPLFKQVLVVADALLE